MHQQIGLQKQTDLDCGSLPGTFSPTEAEYDINRVMNYVNAMTALSRKQKSLINSGSNFARENNLWQYHEDLSQAYADAVTVGPQVCGRLFELFENRRPNSIRCVQILDDSPRGVLLKDMFAFSPFVGTAAFLVCADYDAEDSVLHALQKSAEPPCPARGWYRELLNQIASSNQTVKHFFDALGGPCSQRDQYAMTMLDGWKQSLVNLHCAIANAASILAAGHPAKESAPPVFSVPRFAYCLGETKRVNAHIFPFDLFHLTDYLQRFFSAGLLELQSAPRYESKQGGTHFLRFGELQVLLRSMPGLGGQKRISLSFPKLSDFSVRVDEDSRIKGRYEIKVRCDIGSIDVFDPEVDFFTELREQTKDIAPHYSTTVDSEGSLKRTNGRCAQEAYLMKKRDEIRESRRATFIAAAVLAERMTLIGRAQYAVPFGYHTYSNIAEGRPFERGIYEFLRAWRKRETRSAC